VYNPRLDAVKAPTGFGTGKLWRVGPTRQFKKPSDVMTLVKDGDVVEIDAATYTCDTSVKWQANYLTLRGVGGRPIMDSTGCSISGGKGIWNPMYMVNSMIVDNIEFMGAKVGDRNGAGIRFDGTGYLYITRSYFHDNENGVLLTPGTLADIVIDHSEFSKNGAGDGYTHNMYISGATNSFVLRYSYSHDAHIGHEVKSRALTNYILYSRLSDEINGDSSYTIDLPQGGLSYIIGNVIQQGKNSPNYAIISYSAEGTHNPIQKVYISHNTIVNVGISPASARAVNLYDNNLTEAVMANNLIVGINAANIVGGASTKMVMKNNLITDKPEFYDQTNRIYSLKSTSPAIDAAIDGGTGNSISLSPLYQFAYPATADARTTYGKALDIGAYEYSPTQVVVSAPAITFSSSKTSVDYNSPVTLTWSTTNADSCQASGGWSGVLALTGKTTSSSLTAKQTFTITCSGRGGVASQSLTVTVNDSPEAVALGTYTWQEVPNSQINSVSAANLKDAKGNFVYANNFGTGPYTESKGGYATGVYVPELGKWYLMGGGGGRNYYGNEVYDLNLATMKPERATDPINIGDTKEYTPDDVYGSKIHITGCNGILHLQSTNAIVPAPRGIVGTAAYNPLTKKIVVGGSGVVRGIGSCDGSTSGQMATDMWSFDPFTNSWSLLRSEDEHLSSVTTAGWFLDPATGIVYSSSNRNASTRGGYLIDTTKRTPPIALVDNVWPFEIAEAGHLAIDTTNHYALTLGVGAGTDSLGNSFPRVGFYSLNGLSMTVYGTAGSEGTTGTAGGSGPLYKADLTWKVTGEVSMLASDQIALTYNSKLKKFVAWTGGDVIYLLTPNYSTKTLNILAKHVYGNPSSSVDIATKFTYIPEKDYYLVFVGTDKNFFILKP
jgi:hypothetical protein